VEEKGKAPKGTTKGNDMKKSIKQKGFLVFL
jgi:hypothetical protein